MPDPSKPQAPNWLSALAAVILLLIVLALTVPLVIKLWQWAL